MSHIAMPKLALIAIPVLWLAPASNGQAQDNKDKNAAFYEDVHTVTKGTEFNRLMQITNPLSQAGAQRAGQVTEQHVYNYNLATPMETARKLAQMAFDGLAQGAAQGAVAAVVAVRARPETVTQAAPLIDPSARTQVKSLLQKNPDPQLKKVTNNIDNIFVPSPSVRETQDTSKQSQDKPFNFNSSPSGYSTVPGGAAGCVLDR